MSAPDARADLRRRSASRLPAAFATVVLRIGGLPPGAAASTAACTLAFGVLAAISLAAAAEAMRLRPDAGDAARAAPPASAIKAPM